MSASDHLNRDQFPDLRAEENTSLGRPRYKWQQDLTLADQTGIPSLDLRARANLDERYGTNSG